MAAKRKPVTVIRVEREGALKAFRHGRLRPFYGIPAHIISAWALSLHRNAESVGVVLTPEDIAHMTTKEYKRILPISFSTGDVLRIEMHPGVFRASLTANEDVFKKPKKVA